MASAALAAPPVAAVPVSATSVGGRFRGNCCLSNVSDVTDTLFLMLQ
jgi:hypothetical protein